MVIPCILGDTGLVLHQDCFSDIIYLVVISQGYGWDDRLVRLIGRNSLPVGYQPYSGRKGKMLVRSVADWNGLC